MLLKVEVMKYTIETYNQYNLEEKKYNLCPICSHLRSAKNQNKKCLLADWKTGIGTCQHCGKVIQLHKYKGFKSGLNHYVQRIKVPKPMGSFHTRQFLRETWSKSKLLKNNLSEYLKLHFQSELIFKAEKKLMIFSTNDFYQNSTCYPYINQHGKVTGIKVMPYYVDGKRRRNINGSGAVSWMHCIHKIENWVNEFCLFGLHQIKHRNDKTVHIVESEKTAFIMTVAKPEFIWLATGGLTMLNKQKLMPLKNHKIILHPDKGSAFLKWKEFSDELKGWDIITSRITEDNPFIENKGDLADYYLLKG
jgi:hypothetical protein